MSDYLDSDEVDACMRGHLADLWNNELHKVVYVQQAKNGEFEIYGNRAAAAFMGRRQLAMSKSDQLGSWIDALQSNGRLHAAVFAGQGQFNVALEQALAQGWSAQVRRVVREGDCQGSSNFGTSTEQAITERMLATAGPSEQRIAITPVLGTQMLFVQANFCYDDSAFFGNWLKSCRPEHEVFERVIPQLVAAKGLKQVLFSDAALFDRAITEPRNAPYISMFAVQADPDANARRQCAVLQQRLSSYDTAHPAVGQQTASFNWLEAALGLLGLKSAAPPTATETQSQRCMLRIYLELEQAEALADIQSLSDEAHAMPVTRVTDQRLATAVQLLAKAKLGKLSRDDVTERLWSVCDELDFWWEAILSAGTRQWLRSGSPADWVTLIGERGQKVLQALARNDSEDFSAIRTAFAQAFGSQRLQAVFPFADHESELMVGERYRELRDKLDKALLHPPRAEGTSKLWDPDDMRQGSVSYHRFYTHLFVWDQCYAQQTAQELLDKAHGLWGDSAEHYKAQAGLFLLHDDLDKAQHLCERWLSEYAEDAEAWFCQGTLQFRHQDYPQARESYLRSLALNEKHTQARLEAARCLCWMERSDEAISELRALINNGYSPAAGVLLGNLLYEKGQHVDALAVYRSLKAEDIEAYSGRMFYLLSIFHHEGWEAACAEYSENIERIGEFHRRSFIYRVATDLQNAGRADLVYEQIVGLLQFDEEWDLAVYRVADCCFECSKCSEGRDILSKALTASCAEEYLSLSLAQSFIYTFAPKEQDFARCLTACLEGLEQYPESYDLCNLAGQAAMHADCEGDDFFQRALTLLEAIPADEHGALSRQSQAVALFNLQRLDDAVQTLDSLPPSAEPPYLEFMLFRTLLACAEQAEDLSQRYEAARQQLLAQEPWRIRTELLHHLVDLELYGKRGLVPDWQARQATAQRLLNP